MRYFSLILLLATSFLSLAKEGAPTGLITGEGTLPIVLGDPTSSDAKAAGELLASGLEKISGRPFEIGQEGRAGKILIATAQQLPGVLPEGGANRVPSQMREDYLLQSNGQDVLILARTDAGLKSAVWDFLYRLGYRQFFPGAKWEIWPQSKEITVALNDFQSPDFYSRKLAAAGMNWPKAVAYLEDWNEKNRMVPLFELRTTHIYGAIISAFPEHFKEHPEDIVPNDHPEAIKLDPSRESVLKVAAEFAITSKEKFPHFDSISMDPSDGSGWRKDSPLGSASNQAVTLANYVAQALQGPYPGMKVGILAYHEHSPPPTVPVDRNVIVSVAAGFIKGGYKFDELLKLWGQWGNETGVYEYLSVSLWDRCQPGLSRASDIQYLKRTIPEYHRLGARYYRSEMSNSWAPHGLGYYLASRMLWDTNEANHIDGLLEDFYTRAFGAAAPTMRQYFEKYLLAEGGPLLSRDLVGRMYRTLAQALEANVSTAERSRILDFVEYAHFLELSLDCYEASDSDLPGAYGTLCEFLWRTRDSLMVNGGNYFWKSNHPDHSAGTLFGRKVARPAKWTDPAHPWKKGGPVTEEESLALLESGIKRNSVSEIEMASFSTHLVAFPEEYPSEMAAQGTERLTLWRDQRLYVLVPEETGKVYFSVKPRSREHGPVSLRLFSKENALVNEPVSQVEVPNDGVEHHIILTSPYGGVHELEYSDGNGHALVTWPKGQKVVFPVSAIHSVTPQNICNLAFYVPAGTSVVGMFVEKPVGTITSAEGKELFDFSALGAPGYVSIPVPEGEDGKFWVMNRSSGRRVFLNIPPYTARYPSELLIPEEVLPKSTP